MDKRKNFINVSVELPRRYNDELVKRSKEKGMTKSALIIQILKNYTGEGEN